MRAFVDPSNPRTIQKDGTDGGTSDKDNTGIESFNAEAGQDWATDEHAEQCELEACPPRMIPFYVFVITLNKKLIYLFQVFFG